MRDALSALTVRGRAFLAAGITTTLCSIVLGFDALMRVGVLATALPLLAAYFVGRARYRLMAHRNIVPARVVAGQDAHVHLALVNDGRMPMGLLLFEDRVPYVLGRPARFTVDHMGANWHQNVGYTIRSSVRGHYAVGPLSVRVSDPFGLIALRRSFTSTSDVIVTPAISPLPGIDVSGEWVGSGERRPRAFSAGSAEDVTVREYRRGDDLRRVHWRSSAHAGELMVRREEQPWQSRATVLLDTRDVAHAGSGSASSLEWAVSAAASACVHLVNAGFSVRLVTDRPDSESTAFHDRTVDPAQQTGPIVDQLAIASLSPELDLRSGCDALTTQPGLILAILGKSSADDLAKLVRAAPSGSKTMVMLLDTDQWVTARPGPANDLDRQLAMMKRHAWRAAVVTPQQRVADVWSSLGHRAPTLHGSTPATPAQQVIR